MIGLIPRTEYGPQDGLNYEFSWGGGGLRAHLLSDVGRKRQNNEDSCLMCFPRDLALCAQRGVLFAVADGMGGASAGEYASRIALHLLAHTYYTGLPKPVPEALREAIEAANERIFEEAEVNPVYAGMGTTVSAIVLLGDWIYVAHVGDSRVYLLRERSGIHQITRDHSLVAEQVRSGLISDQEARNHSLRNLITRAVGIKEMVKADLFAVRIQRGDTLLLCSDGLCGTVSDVEIAHNLAAGDLQAGTRALVQRALDTGSTDNVTAVVVRLLESPSRTEYQEGAEEIKIGPNGFFARVRGLFS